MNALYCKKCGHKNLYSLTRPKFCNSCGQPFSSSRSTTSEASSSSKKIEKSQSSEIIDPDDSDIDPDDSDIDYVPNINNLSYTIDYSDVGSIQHKGADFINLPIENLDQNKKPKSRRGRKAKNNLRRK